MRDITASLLSEVCHGVTTEPHLQSLLGKIMSHCSAITDDGVCLDIAVYGFWGGRFEKVFLDVRVFNPIAQMSCMYSFRCWVMSWWSCTSNRHIRCSQKSKAQVTANQVHCFSTWHTSVVTYHRCKPLINSCCSSTHATCWWHYQWCECGMFNFPYMLLTLPFLFLLVSSIYRC